MKSMIGLFSKVLILGVVIFSGTVVGPAEAAETIVGKWASTKAECSDVSERVVISAMRIESSFMICQFSGVKRKGNTVTWTGHCFDEGGGRRPEEPDDDGEMVAKLSSKKLTLEGLGFGMGPLIRCK